MKLPILLLTALTVCNVLFGDSQAIEAVTRDNARFALALFDTLESDQDHCISPYSIASALFIPYVGAEGETEQEMSDVLEFYMPKETLADTFSAINRALTYHPSNFPDSFRLLMANSLWVQTGNKLLPDFRSLVEKNLGAKVRNVDFIKQTETARQQINGWVQQQTSGKIENLLSEGAVDKATRMVVVSALYAKGKWQQPFNPDSTRAEPFFPDSSQTITLPMMHQTEMFGYAETDSYQALELPLEYPGREGPQLVMTVILPKKEQPFTLDLPTLQAVSKQLTPERVSVTLPKFQLRDQMSVKKSLMELGMEQPFSLGADFSGIAGARNLVISDVIHETYFDVAEAGVEAAAATAVIMMRTSLPIGEPVLFTADHPFYFMLRDLETGALLFLGHYRGSFR